ncbi:MAG TPA: hypothetical protein VGB24_06200 [Longimicrobium sp.]|uniref:hypothetical protein n=1 Tax=Longimicrobium sp. TaxID=2029185 RepID=UPI002EDA0526
MLRSILASTLVWAAAGCAAAAEPATTRGPERVTRNTTMVTTVDAAGGSKVTSVTTTSYAAAAETQIARAPDAVFGVLGGVYEDLGITVGTIDAPNRTTGNTQIRARGRLGRAPISTYLDCGNTGLQGAAANSFPVRLSVLSSVTPEGEGSRLRTVVEGVYTSAESSGAVACSSTGELEGAIARAVQVRVTAN